MISSRQMFRQWPANRVTPLRPWRARRDIPRCGLAGGLAFFEILKPQFQLMYLRVERLGRLAKLQPAQLVQLRLVLRDKQMGTGQFGARRRQFGRAFGELGTQLGDLFEGIHRPRF
jgi:hypothetical protein